MILMINIIAISLIFIGNIDEIQNLYVSILIYMN